MFNSLQDVGHASFFVICLFLKKSRHRYKYKKCIWHAYTILHRQKTVNL